MDNSYSDLNFFEDPGGAVAKAAKEVVVNPSHYRKVRAETEAAMVGFLHKGILEKLEEKSFKDIEIVF